MTIKTDKLNDEVRSRIHSSEPTHYLQKLRSVTSKGSLWDARSLVSLYSACSYSKVIFALSAFLLLSSSFIQVSSDGALKFSQETSAYAQAIADHAQIDLSAIAQIESSGRSHAVGDGGRALGLYQLHAAVIKDYNRTHKTHLSHKDALDPSKARLVADWYLNTEIPRLLRHYNLPDTVSFRIRGYNEGLRRSINGRAPSRITRAYIVKYELILKQRRGVK